MVHHEHLALDPEPASVRSGRHFLQRHLERWDLGELVDTAALLASEALTNAVVHAQTPLVLEVYTDGALTIEVIDQDSTTVLTPVATLGLESLLDEPDIEATNGRGLALIAALADDWGIREELGGKTVWFTFPLPDDASPSPTGPPAA